MTGTGYGTSVTGFIADASNPFDPVADGYPTSNPTTGFTPKDEGFAGIIYAQPPGGGANSSLYCIDINTYTYPGIGYALGTWDAANVPNVGYVARLLNDYYPNTDEPSSLTDLNQRAAAVQAAIWFFSDRYVLSTSDPLHDIVAAITAQIISEGPLPSPPPPSLTLTPSSVSGPAGGVLGPFTVTTNAANAAVTATGANMFSDSAGTAPIANGATVPSGQKIWVRSTGTSTAELQATSEATVPSGNVYLYDGNGGVDDAQKLILAQTSTLTTTVQATAEFLPPGSLVVTKTIAGPAAGSQGAVDIHVACDDGVSRPDFIVRANAPAGSTSQTYPGIPAGTMCTVTETSNGSVVGVDVVVTGDGQQVTIPSGAREKVKITDTYHYVGSLLVRKTIAGPAAGQQGPVTIHSVCNGSPLSPDFTIGAGARAGDYTAQYDHITVPATCTVTETVDGHTNTVSVVVQGSGQTVSIPRGDVAQADISDTYGLVPGELEVTKTIAGPSAGQQGEVVIHTVCNGTPLTPDFTIPAGAPAGDQSYVYSGIPAQSTCVSTETANGATSTVTVATTGSPSTTTIPAGGAEAAHITDTYGPALGSLLVTKTIAGPRAGYQGRVVIRVTCNGTVRSPDFVIAARTQRGSVSHSFDGIPAGSSCIVNEIADGATSRVTVTVSGSGQKVTVPAGKVVAVNVMDVYDSAPGSLKVTKRIVGRAARQHGRIAILVACGVRFNAFAFIIPARTGPGSVSRYFDGLQAGSRCTVFEAVDGRTHNVSVVVTGRRQRLAIRAGTTASARIGNLYFKPKPPPYTG